MQDELGKVYIDTVYATTIGAVSPFSGNDPELIDWKGTDANGQRDYAFYRRSDLSKVTAFDKDGRSTETYIERRLAATETNPELIVVQQEFNSEDYVSAYDADTYRLRHRFRRDTFIGDKDYYLQFARSSAALPFPGLELVLYPDNDDVFDLYFSNFDGTQTRWLDFADKEYIQDWYRTPTTTYFLTYSDDRRTEGWRLYQLDGNVGVAEAAPLEVSVFPSLLSGGQALNIAGAPAGARYRIYDQQGRASETGELRGDASIPWGARPAGAYVVYVEAPGYASRAWWVVGM